MKYLFVLLMLATTLHAEDACVGVDKTPIPAGDEPAQAELARLKDCDSESSYYGIGKPADYATALKCAYAERADGDGLVFGGSAVLMMLYANGYGVKKNPALALRFACKIEGAPAEVESRTAELKARVDGGGESTPLDVCSHATSGLLGGHCSARDERLAAVKRDAELKKTTDAFTGPAKEAYAKLKTASDEFTEARSRDEVDLSGTARATFVIAEEAIQKKDFLESLQKLEAKKAPKYSAAQAKKEDAELNRLYGKIQSGPDGFYGTITKDGVKTAQKAWLAYRDAWVAFAKVRYPSYPGTSLAAWFTKKRNHMLRSFAK